MCGWKTLYRAVVCPDLKLSEIICVDAYEIDILCDPSAVNGVPVKVITQYNCGSLFSRSALTSHRHRA